MGGDGRHSSPLQGVEAALDFDDVILGEELIAIGKSAAARLIVRELTVNYAKEFISLTLDKCHALANFLLNLVDGVAQLLGDGVAAQGLHVEVVCLGREDEECHNGDVTAR